MSDTALIIVDMQNDFVLKDAPQCIDVIKKVGSLPLGDRYDGDIGYFIIGFPI